MRSFVLLTFFLVLVPCRSGSDKCRQLRENDRLRDDREDGARERSYNGENNRGTGGQLSGRRPGESGNFSNNREASGEKSEARPHGNSGNQFGSRASDQGILGRPMQESKDLRASQDGNNFSGTLHGSTFGGSRPGDSSTSAQSSGFRSTNEDHSGRANEGSTFGQSSSSGSRPTNVGHSGRYKEGSTSDQSTGFRSTNEGHTGRHNEGSTSGQSTGSRPTNEGHSGRPTQGSSSSSLGGSRPGNEGHSSRGSGQGSQLGGATGFEPDNKGHSSERPTQASGGLEPANEGQSSVGPESDINQSAHEGQSSGPQRSSGDETQNYEEDEKDVCFANLGCFKMGKPWKSALRPIGAPQPPEKIQTTLLFYSREHPLRAQNITLYPSIHMGTARFDPNKMSAILVHGFANSGNATWLMDLKYVYLAKVDANVMVVDWGKGAQQINYLQVAANTRVVGKQLGIFVKFLIEHYGANPGRFHLIGHSLGAQICSYLAKDVPGIGRLTALDPAQPGFEGFTKEVRLDESDAEFVEVVHTDARPFIPTLGFGMVAPYGHVDFYMNGGFDQPGCLPPPKKDLPTVKTVLDLAKFTVEVVAKAVACPHSRAYEYLIEAYNETKNCVFWGHKTDAVNVFKTVTNTVTQGLFKKFMALSTSCSREDCIPLGFATKKSPLRGTFVVTTRRRSPYCNFEPGVSPETVIREKDKKSLLEKIKDSILLAMLAANDNILNF